MIARRSAGLVRWWVGQYTNGLPVDARDARREEIAADLWDQLADASSSGRPDRSTGVEILVRLALGVPADLNWRRAQGVEDRVKPGLAPRGAPATRLLGLLALVGGLFVSIGAVVFTGRIVAGASIQAWTVDPLQTSIMVGAGTLGMIAVVVATAGLVIRYRHHTRTRAVVAASAAAVGAVLFLVDVWPAIYLVPLGFAYFIWDLGCIGVLPRWVVAANVAAALALLVPLAAITGDSPVGVTIVLVIPYWITWLAIGESLIRGTPASQGA